MTFTSGRSFLVGKNTIKGKRKLLETPLDKMLLKINRKRMEIKGTKPLPVLSIITFDGKNIRGYGKALEHAKLWRALNMNCSGKKGARTTFRMSFPKRWRPKNHHQGLLVLSSDLGTAGVPFYVSLLGIPSPEGLGIPYSI